jgi:hypothetical protein
MNTVEQGLPFRASRRLYKNPVLWVFVATLLVLAIHPIPECFACEFPHPWGRNDIAYVRASIILDVWLIGASFAAGLGSLRKYWLVPIAIVLADVITQPIGGVALWSLWSNEGPLILGLGGLIGVAAMLLGALVRLMLDKLRTPEA